MAAVIFCCLGTAPFGGAAVASDPAQNGYILESSPADLMGAHNERMLVVFGTKVEFKRYFLVGLLSQSMTVATDVSGGVRYDLKSNGRARVLTIP